MSTDRMILGENAFYSTDCNLTGQRMRKDNVNI